MDYAAFQQKLYLRLGVRLCWIEQPIHSRFVAGSIHATAREEGSFWAQVPGTLIRA